MRKVGLLLCLIGRLWTAAAAQDSFHIRVHEYEPLAKGFVFEEHTNYFETGSELHLAHEFTAGVTPAFSLGAMLLNARRSGAVMEYAGWKILPHLYAPTAWRLPARIGVVAEFTVQPKTYADGSGELEIHPIVEKRIKNIVLVTNPSFGRTLNAGNSEGWTFNPALRAAYDISNRLTLGVDYYSHAARFSGAHASADIKLTDSVVWSLGVNAGPATSENRLVYTSRVQFSWGQK